MTINGFRSLLYRSAKALGDVQAVDKAVERSSLVPIEKRIGRRLVGRLTGRLMGMLFR